MGVLGECLAEAHEFVHKDKVYKVGLVNQAVKLKFERALFHRAKEAALEMRDLMTPDEYRDHLKQLNDDYIGGQYGMDSPRGLEVLRSVQGGITLVALLFGVDNAEAVQLIMERKDDVTALLQVVLHESFPAMNGDGKADGAEKKVLTKDK